MVRPRPHHVLALLPALAILVGVPFANRVLRIEDGLIVGEERRTEGVETIHELARNRKRKANA